MQYTKKTLKNGLRIITVPVKGNQTATVVAYAEVGSNYETQKTNGISHFLEHMLFKGTENRTLHEITEELDGIGAINNAFTGDEYTGYWAKAHHKHLDKLIDVISDVYINSTIPKEEIEKERGVIIEEINMYEDLPRRRVQEHLEELMYKGQPAGRSIAGPKNNIRAFKRNDFLNHKKKHYTTGNTIVVVAGKIDEKKVQKLVTEKFKKLPKGKQIRKVKIVDRQKEPLVKIAKKDTDQTHFVIGFRGYSAKDKKSIATELLSVILGKGMSSRLFKKMRDELGICYYVSADNDASTGHGSFRISAGVSAKRFEEAVSTIIDILKDIKEKKVSEKELKKAKEYLIGSLALSVESSDSWAQFYASQEIIEGRMKDFKEISKEIRSVTADDVQKVAKDIFVKDKANLAAIGRVSRVNLLKNL